MSYNSWIFKFLNDTPHAPTLRTLNPSKPVTVLVLLAISTLFLYNEIVPLLEVIFTISPLLNTTL